MNCYNLGKRVSFSLILDLIFYIIQSSNKTLSWFMYYFNHADIGSWNGLLGLDNKPILLQRYICIYIIYIAIIWYPNINILRSYSLVGYNIIL